MNCLIIVLTTTSVHARGFEWYCSLSNGPVYGVVKDLSTGELFFTNGTRGDSVLEGATGGRRRLSAPLDASPFDDFDEETSSQKYALRVKRRTADEIVDGSGDMSDIILMRECRCAGSREAYCPAYLSACGIPRTTRENQTPGCVYVNKRRSFARTLFLVVVIAYAMLILCMFTTWGKNVIGFFADTLFPGWNLFLANRMMRRDPERSNEWIRRHLLVRRRMLQRRYRAMMGPESLAQEYAARATAIATEHRFNAVANSPSNPISLALKTRIHRAVIPVDELEMQPPKREDDEEGINEETCTICFGSLEEGDRVGDLACFHTFHAECLKSWLSRRNVCPLCQRPNAATPQFGDAPLTTVEPAEREVI